MPHDRPDAAFDAFRASLGLGQDALAAVRDGVIGKDALVGGPFGPKPLLYADYVASGRALRQVEGFVLDQVLPWYANSHTEASFCGATMTRLRAGARAEIARACSAGPEHAVVFAGAGATAGLNRLVHLFDLPGAVARGDRPLVLLGPYEHHSNILPWRESGAEVRSLPEGAAGGPDPQALRAELAAARGRPVVVALSAASNITGTVCDVAGLTRLVKAAGARMVWDHAGAGPYLPVSMTPAPGTAIDAIVLSPHKFIGGPGASGVLILRRDAVTASRPSLPGGGTVRFVSPDGHDYATRLESREESGTPNVVGDIRAALAFLVRDAVGTDLIASRHAALEARATAAWRTEARLVPLHRPGVARLPIHAFRVRDGAGGFVHQQLVTRLLSDLHGVQARGGCACAGPYVHALLGIDAATSARMRAAILSGREVDKPGFTRLNLCWLLSDAQADRLIAAVADVARRGADLARLYEADPETAIFRPRSGTTPDPQPDAA